MSGQYLNSEQNERIRRWERINRSYFIFAFFTLLIIMIFSSQLGLSSGESWGPLGVLIAAIVAPIVVLQLRLQCPACGHKIGWQAKLMAPDQCKACGTFLRAKNASS